MTANQLLNLGFRNLATGKFKLNKELEEVVSGILQRPHGYHFRIFSHLLTKKHVAN